MSHRIIRQFINAHLKNKDTGFTNSQKTDLTNIVVPDVESGQSKFRSMDSSRKDKND